MKRTSLKFIKINLSLTHFGFGARAGAAPSQFPLTGFAAFPTYHTLGRNCHLLLTTLLTFST